MNKFCPEFSCHERRGGYDFWLSPGCPDKASVIDQVLAGVSEGQLILKQDHKRLLYVGSSSGSERFIVKLNLLPRFKDRWRAHRQAPQECFSHLRVASYGLPVPELWGYFHQKRWGMTARNGLIIAFLPEARNLRWEEGAAAVPLLASLYEHGINHPDFMQNNVMLTPEKKVVLIDLEECTFGKQRDIRLPLMQLARFIEYSQTSINEQNNRRLIEETYTALNKPIIDRENFQRAVTILNQRHLKTRQRVKLWLPEEVKMILTGANQS